MSKTIKRILVSQPKPANSKSPYFQLAEETGVEIDFKQLFSIVPVSAREFRDQKVDILGHTGVVLNSRTIADHFFQLVKELRVELPEDYKYFCSSEVIATYLQKHITVRKRKVFFPEKSGNIPDLAALIHKYNKERYFIPTIEGVSEQHLSDLDEQSINFTSAVMSRIVYTPVTKEEIDSYDLLIFFSPNGVQSLFASIPDYTQGDQLVGCLGEGTLRSLEEANIKVVMAVPNKDFTSINAALDHLVKSRLKKHV
ncbi:uroporphyrinogen-III synthase [Porphyromonas levii]|uniref:Uroporphyrinogen-III synthase n=1 Tax=Porphyromonas levii TaxID=28114 RepID=A0A4Y8WQA5_9PORP|nr:uroporphyrinogen-III synthase [Porphyromonas levii]MBR8713086.1 hypothetical protein [Porphyromonas levii]MBR8715110.1 hypothetical protein [Porphyromonas levii]MBR8727617.1 hypothetical protein [Porphyromonas levii]MBR8729050.1 hypothetical protein [Porphyromonas levii]MBR8731893.1 hypothetical protein [Porphyromonas levii]